MNSEKRFILKDKKISGSGLRVLELLKALMKEPLSLPEIFKIIEEKNNILFKKEALWKYINTLKFFGYNVVKDKEKYVINTLLETTDYTEQDLEVFEFIKEHSEQMNFKSPEKNISKTLSKIERTFSPKTKKLQKRLNSNAQESTELLREKEIDIQKYEKYCKDGLKLNIKYKTSADKETVFKISPLNIILRKHKAILIAYDCKNCEYKEFFLDFITDAEQTPQKSSSNFTSTIIFKLKGRLANSYVLKEGEKLLEYNNDYSVIASSQEDKTLLLNRLVRYYGNCEIVYPIDVRERMIKLIEDIIKIYE